VNTSIPGPCPGRPCTFDSPHPVGSHLRRQLRCSRPLPTGAVRRAGSGTCPDMIQTKKSLLRGHFFRGDQTGRVPALARLLGSLLFTEWKRWRVACGCAIHRRHGNISQQVGGVAGIQPVDLDACIGAAWRGVREWRKRRRRRSQYRLVRFEQPRGTGRTKSPDHPR